MSDPFNGASRTKLQTALRRGAMLPNWVRRLGYYWLALLFVAAAVTLRWGLRDVLSPTPTLVFYLAWVGAAAFGGLGPGLLATAASLLCIELLFDPIVAQISFADPLSLARLLILLAGGLIVSVVGEMMRRTRIRERRQMQELADLTQLTSLGQLLIRDDQDRILLWSDGCARLYGFTAEQAVGRVSHELLKTEFPQPLETIRATLHKTGRWEGEQTHRRADGSVVHVASLWVLRDGTAHPVVLEVNNDITDRKRAEAALREARNGLEIRVQERTAQLRKAKELVESERQRFQNILDQLPAYLVLLTPDFHVAFANRFFEERFGKCEGQRCYEYLFHRTEPCEICNAHEVLKTNAPQHWEWIGPDGRNYDIHDFPFTDMDGAPLVMEVGLDITERKRAEAELVKHREHLEELVQERTGQLETANEELRENEQALHDAKERLHLAMEAGKVGIWEWGVGTEDVEWSQGVYALLGYKAGEVTPTHEAFRQRIHPQDRERQDQALHDSLERCQDYLCEFRVIWVDGSVHWIEARGQYVYVDNGNGAVLRMRGVLSDIDQRKQAEEALRESEDRFRKLFKANLAGVYITKLDGTILDFNDAMMRMLGYDSREELLQHRSTEFFADPEFRKLLLNLLQRDGFVPAKEAVLRRKDGSVLYAIGSGVLLVNEQTGEPYIQGAAIDITERKQAEEALRRSEEQFHRLFEDDLTGNFISTPEGRILLCNPAFAEIFGFSRALDAVGTSILDLYADPGEREPLLERLKQEGKVDRLEVWRKRRDGEPIHIVENLVGHFNDQGELYEIKGYVIEDTERKQAEEALRQSESFYRQTLESIPGMVFTTRPDGYCDYQSQPWVDYTGVPMAEHLGYGWNKLLHPEDRPRALAAWRDAVEGKAPYDLEYRVRRHDGEYEWFKVIGRPIRDETGQIVRWFGVAMNIEAIKQAEEALREALAQAEEGRGILQAMMDHIPMGITIADAPDTNIRMVSRYGRELIERTNEELTGIPAEAHPQKWQVYHADGVTPATAEELPLTRATQQGEIVKEEEWVVTRRDGTEIPILCTAAPIRDKEGHITGGVIGWQDITQRKRIEARLQGFNEELEREVRQRTAELLHRTRQLQKLTLDLSETEDRERKRMAEILHDDLQQQLAAAKFHLGLMRSRVRYDASAQATAAQIDHMLMEAIQKSRGLSHELSPAVMHHADFTETLRWLANQVQTKHGLVVRVHARGEVRAESDALKGFLYKMVQELLFNVVKHARVDEAKVGIRYCGECIYLSVSDRGRGFDPQALRDAAGFGLLSIRERIELLGGRMKIRSAKGRGSRFFVMVPDNPTEIGGVGPRAYPASTTPGDHGEKEGGHDGPPLRVLLADDHEIVRQGLVSLLGEEHTIEVVGEAANGREAVDLAERLHPDVIIMDVSMPLIDGDEATRQIKSRWPQTRVIALSMYEQPEKRERMHRAGAESYVLKTAPSEELLAAIRGQPAAA